MRSVARSSLIALCCLALLGLVSSCQKQQSEQTEASANAPDKAKKGAKDEAPPAKKSAEKAPAAQPAGSPKTLEDLPEGVNVLQNEMQLLNSAMQTSLTLIANDNLEGIPAQIKKVHPARQLTMKAVKAGKYEPPQNPDKMDEFEKLDDAFHEDLKGLLKASKQDDLQMATDKYKDLVQGCTNCHTKFRFEQ